MSPRPTRPKRTGVSVHPHVVGGVTLFKSRYTLADGRRPVAISKAPDWTTAFVAACTKQDECERLSYRSREGEKMPFSELALEHYLPMMRGGADNTIKNIYSHLGDGSGTANRRGAKNERAAQFQLLHVFGTTRIGEIGPAEVRTWIAGMVEAGFMRSSMLAKRSLLKAILQVAVDQEWLPTNVVDPIRVPAQQSREHADRVMTPEEYSQVQPLLAMAGEATSLLADLTLDAGLRFEDVTALRPMDVIDGNDSEPAHLWVRQAVAWVGRKHNRLNPGFPWQIKELKGKRARKVALSPHVHARLLAYIEANSRGRNALIFDYPTLRAEHAHYLEHAVERPRGLAHGRFVKGNRSAEHGTHDAYALGCRCPFCRNAHTEYVFFLRRAKGVPMASPWKDANYLKDREHAIDPVKYAWWARYVWSAAVRQAQLDWNPTFHNLRHCMVSWGYEGGATAAVLQAEAGHANMRTTEGYQHRLDSKVSGARLEAMAKMYARMNGVTAEPEPPQPVAAESTPVATSMEQLVELVMGNASMTPADKAAMLVALMAQNAAQATTPVESPPALRVVND